ncbi:MAG: phosphate-starvation-inducible PsiE family protein [Rhizonema sp. NSF051]|nr:phosphate-starvation-inducible PsiE family protein [Rhizonema sp. NSF051]
MIFLCIGLFGAMVVQLADMFHALLHMHSLQEITSDTLILLILLELFRLLVIYFQEHLISVGVAVEVAIVSILREIIVRGLLEIPSEKILAIGALLLALGVLLLVRSKILPSTDTISNTLK